MKTTMKTQNPERMTTMKTTNADGTIRLEAVKSVYSGKPGRCCCGCSGKHTRSSAWECEDWHTVNDSTVARHVAALNAAILAGEQVDRSETYIAHVIGNRLVIAYFAKPTDKRTPQADVRPSIVRAAAVRAMIAGSIPRPTTGWDAVSQIAYSEGLV